MQPDRLTPPSLDTVGCCGLVYEAVYEAPEGRGWGWYVATCPICGEEASKPAAPRAPATLAEWAEMTPGIYARGLLCAGPGPKAVTAGPPGWVHDHPRGWIIAGPEGHRLGPAWGREPLTCPACGGGPNDPRHILAYPGEECDASGGRPCRHAFHD
jgi:hypothetical protein